MKFESILSEINGFGKFQLMIVLIQSVSRITLPAHFLLNIFIAAVPSHHCDTDSWLAKDLVFKNLTLDQRRNVSFPVEEDGAPSSCLMYSKPQYHLLFNNSNTTNPTTEPCKGWVYDNSTFKSTLATEWDLVCSNKGMNKATATIFFIGIMMGAPVFGLLSDRFGRRPLLMVSYLLTMLFSVVSALSTSYVMFMIMRFLTGFTITGISIISIVLSVEWFDVEHRTFAGIIVSLDWTIGNLMLAGVAWLVNDWRWLIIAVTSPLLLSVVLWWWLPESARWLITRGKAEQAHVYLQRCAEMNKCKADFTPETLANAVTVERDRRYTVVDLLKTPNIRKLAICTGIVWFGVAFTYYGISLNVTGFGLNIYITQFIYAFIEMPGKIGVYYFLNKIGRRPGQVWTLLLTGVCLIINMFVPSGFWIVRTVVAVLGKGLSEASFTIMFLYTTELYPTVVRQNGIGYTSFIARMGVAIAPLIILLEDVWKLLPDVVFCSVAVLAGIVACLLPETRDARLPEFIEDIEESRWFPESARWLIASGQLKKAQFYLQNCAKMNQREVTSSTKAENLAFIVVKEKGSRKYSYLDLVRTPKMRKLAMLTGMTWFGVAATAYGIGFNITGFGVDFYLTQFIYAVTELPAKLSVYYLLEKFGRRKTEAGSLLITGVCLGINIFISKDRRVVRTIVAVLAKGFSAVSFCTVVLHSSELYPTVIRQNGMGYNSFMARVGVASAPMILLLEEVWTNLAQVVLCSIAILTSLVASFLPETRGKCLPETIEDIEGKRDDPVGSPSMKTEETNEL
ncbi:solute carrier family 22 member 7-like isoform X1 [Alosa pseudoharengus]|uniref:solute carrier family 22 member 7-like isoform X1 n=1 Tax=Alosa pseudoharengus TaxID=34774 RepID=UPI003F89F84A